MSPNNRDAQLLESRDWRGSLPSLLDAWQTFAQQAPQARVNAFVVSVLNPQGSVGKALELSLQLHTQDDAEQALKRFATSSAKLAPAPVLPDGQLPARLFNPFDATGLPQGLPALEPTVKAKAGLPDTELSQWQWVGAVTSGNQSLALLTHEGQLYTIKPGQALGAQGGEVIQVGIDHVWLRQWVADSQGQWQARSNRWPGKGTP
jgi:hypothetical protein